MTPPIQPQPISDVIQQRRRVWPLNVNQALLILRLVVGLLFVGHANQKLFGLFGGTGMTEFIASVAKLGLNPPVFWAYLEALTELFGGLFLALGLLRIHDEISQSLGQYRGTMCLWRIKTMLSAFSRHFARC
jgi:hypothetical protein